MNLTELLVALILLGLALAGMLTVLEQGQRMYAFGAARVESLQNGRIALERLAREIREAGAGRTSFDAISVAEPRQIVLHVDLDGDGVIARRGETITWRLVGSVLRRDAGGGLQPVIAGVHAFDLGYLDAAGHPTRVPAEVRTVVVTLTTGAERPAAGAGPTTLTTQMRLRNR